MRKLYGISNYAIVFVLAVLANAILKNSLLPVAHQHKSRPVVGMVEVAATFGNRV